MQQKLIWYYFFYFSLKNLNNNLFSVFISSSFKSWLFSHVIICSSMVSVFSMPFGVNSTIFCLLFVGSSHLVIKLLSSKFRSILAVYPLLTLNRLTKSFCVVLSANRILSKNRRLLVDIISSFRFSSANLTNELINSST